MITITMITMSGRRDARAPDAKMTCWRETLVYSLAWSTRISMCHTQTYFKIHMYFLQPMHFDRLKLGTSRILKDFRNNNKLSPPSYLVWFTVDPLPRHQITFTHRAVFNRCCAVVVFYLLITRYMKIFLYYLIFFLNSEISGLDIRYNFNLIIQS